MPSLVIPEIYQRGLTVLLGLSDADCVALAEALQAIPPTLHVKKDIATAVAPRLPKVSGQDVEQLIAAIYSLFELRAIAEVPVDEFVGDLAEAFSATGKSGLTLQSDDRGRFITNMSRVLGVESLNVFAKVNALQRTHEHIFHDCKILTDLRPVFSAPDQEPLGMIVEYTLKIHFHDGSRHKELYMTLDADDIARLRKSIERAEEKAAALTALLDSRDIKQLYLS